MKLSDPLAPLNDHRYEPQHPPTPGGGIPWVVKRWAPRSQIRWFRRFGHHLAVLPLAEWNAHWVDSLSRIGGSAARAAQASARTDSSASMTAAAATQTNQDGPNDTAC